MRILVGCEESQEVCKAFREDGHEAFSCDLLDCSGGHPEWHIKGDIFEALKEKWDYIITFQPCTDLAVSGARWFEEKRKNGSQEKSIRFFFEVWKYSNCSENPVGILNGGDYVKKWFPELYEEMTEAGFPFKPSQIIQPYQFGDPATKTTCLWLKGLPALWAMNVVNKGERHITKSGKSLPKWYNLPPSSDRGILRSKTFPGIAKAMVYQWGLL